MIANFSSEKNILLRDVHRKPFSMRALRPGTIETNRNKKICFCSSCAELSQRVNLPNPLPLRI